MFDDMYEYICKYRCISFFAYLVFWTKADRLSTDTLARYTTFDRGVSSQLFCSTGLFIPGFRTGQRIIPM